MRNPPSNFRRKSQFFSFLPSEIIMDILSRLPTRNIARCKCVCKAWLNLLRTRDFANFHLSKSLPGLVIGGGEGLTWDPWKYKFFYFDDGRGHQLRCCPLTQLESVEFIPSSELLGSANGLLFFSNRTISECGALYVCNPIAREYIELPHHGFVYSNATLVTYGFGASKMTGQHKVVGIFNEWDINRPGENNLLCITKSVCLVYALETGIWRSITPCAPFRRHRCSIGVSLNGNLHWLAEFSDGSRCILCFDLEMEIFSTFSLPLPVIENGLVSLVALEGCLCVCDNAYDEIVIWLMKEYGDESSWTMEFVIRRSSGSLDDYDSDDYYDEVVHPIKVFKDGDILMASDYTGMLYYSNKTKTSTETDLFGVYEDHDEFSDRVAMLHTPSFLSLGSFVKESVSRF